MYDPALCKQAANLLIEKHGIYIQPVFFPTVPKGDERFRVTISPRHEEEDIDRFVEALEDIWTVMGLRRADPEEFTAKESVSRIY